MKFLFLAISLVTFLIEIPDDKKKIIWNQNYQLEWTDFKGKVDQKSDYGAITSSGISTSYEFKKDSILFKVIAVFYKQDSWTKESLQSELGLKHEQVHFDITEIAARRLRKRLREEVFHREDVVEKFKSIKKEILNEKHLLQEKYDLETDHHRNFEMQKEWNHKIKLELENSKEYQDTIVATVLK